MAVRSDGLQTEKRILQACVRLFLENGYRRTTMLQIFKEAQVSSGSLPCAMNFPRRAWCRRDRSKQRGYAREYSLA